MAFSSKITATGSYLPEKIVTNDDLAKKVDTSNEWIIERTGIKQRHVSKNDELTSDIAYKAAQRLLESSKIDAQDIELIILATTTPDLTFPASATTVQAKLGAKNAFAFDIQAVCSGFVFAISTANNFIKSGQVKNALVIGADTLSKIVNWEDRNTCVLFGDGAGAVFLEQCEEGKGIISCDLNSDGNLNSILKTTGGPALNQISGVIEMQGKDVFKHAVTKMSSSVNTALEQVNLTKEDINLLIPHQANIRILEGVAKKLKLRDDQVIITVDKHANTSAASIPLALDEAFRGNKIKDGDVIVLEALGGGLTWGSIILKW
jgi:3-oxoacyl-[acyl-carrier-protein] synthase-3